MSKKQLTNNLRPLVSIIIPARNEASCIGIAIGAVKDKLEGLLPYEIIVLDNNSVDDTAAIASEAGAHTVHSRHGSISELRNFGASLSAAPILVFLDADVVPCGEWLEGLQAATGIIRQDPMVVCGAHYGFGPNPSWIERAWLDPSFRMNSTYVPGGNLIIDREVFFTLNGFSPQHATGEDVDLCNRIVKLGGKVCVIETLHTHHLGNPQTLRAFVRREKWHGAADFESFSRIVSSRVAIATILWLGLHVILGAAILNSSEFIVPAALAIVLLCFGAACYKFGIRHSFFSTMIIQYFYFLGRSLAAGIAVLRAGRMLSESSATK